MSDPELAAIRAARMNQLQQQGGAGGGAQAEEDGGKQAAEEQMRRDLLATILDSAARERRELSFVTPQKDVLIVDVRSCSRAHRSC